MTRIAQQATAIHGASKPRVHLPSGGMLLVGIGLLVIVGIGLFGGWMLDTPPHAYEASLGGLVWSMSVPFGAFLVMLGAATLVHGERRLVALIMAVGGAILGWTVWRDVLNWANAEPPTLLFGAGGTLMLLFFLGATWQWARGRGSRAGSVRTAADLRQFALASILVAAWETCGLFGSPIYLLRPALAETSPLAFYAIPVAASVLVYLTIGFALMYVATAVDGRGYQKVDDATEGK